MWNGAHANESAPTRLSHGTHRFAGQLEQFTINTDGTLSNAGGAGLGTAPSITTIGTYK